MYSPFNILRPHTLLVYLILSIVLFNPRVVIAQVQIWGVANQGGSDDIGSIFNFSDNGSGFQLKSEFKNSIDGSKPKTRMVTGTDGSYYGITSQGGMNNGGSIFRYGSNGFENLYNLDPTADGSNARGDMVEISPGVFIGSTSAAAGFNAGSLFRYSVEDGFTLLHTFQPSTDGGNPTGAIACDSINKIIYGTCSSGGISGFGTSFSYTLTEGFAVLHHFMGATGGAYPQGGVIKSTDGYLYGTTQYGGSYSQGTIFRINPENSEYEIIYHLNTATSDGRYPFGRLVESSPGVFMGTCNEGGSSGTGTIFKITTEGVYTRLKSLQSTADGGYPKAGLCQTGTGLFYGITEFGGSNGFGTIFSISESGNFLKLKNLDYEADGSQGLATLAYDGSNTLIGSASDGGVNNFGTLFTISLEDQNFEKIHDFSLPLAGANPVSLYANGDRFFGTTQEGGTFNAGVFFKTALDGTTQKLHDFNPATDGQKPNGDLFLGNDGYYYGTARFGGDGNSGTVFKISQNGELTVLHSFDGSAGQFPYGGVLVHSNGDIYGTTVAGGAFGDGVLFKLSEDGQYTVVTEFFGFFDGGNPEAGLAEGADGLVYGTNTTGGYNNAGTLFQYDPQINLVTVVHHFDTYTEGEIPKARLLLHSDGKLYGTTTAGLLGGGAIYKYNTDSGVEVVHAFNTNTDGTICGSSLAEDETGKLYGFCTYGGTSNLGTCFSYDQTNGFTTLYSFSSENSLPVGTPAFFFPECSENDDCLSTDSCKVASCNYGICEETMINPIFTPVTIGDCELDQNVFDMSLSISMDAHPGGILLIGTDTIHLTDGVYTYTLSILNLPSNGQDIIFDYIFEESGCSGSTGVLGIAPDPCPPVLITFILDAGDLEVNPGGIYIGGSFEGWNPDQNPMFLNSEGFWEKTLALGSGAHEFNFFNGTSIFDVEYVYGDCAINGKRQLLVGEDSETLTFCWMNCKANCSVGIAQARAYSDFQIIPNLVIKGEMMHFKNSDLNHDLIYSIINNTGQQVMSGSIDSDKTDIGTSTLNSGLYTVILSKTKTSKIVGVKRFMVLK